MAPKAIRRRALSAGQTHKAMEARMKKLVGTGRGRGFTLQDHTGRVTLQHNALGRDPIEIIDAGGDPTHHGGTWYRLQGIDPPPTAFRYDQPLIHGAYVQNFKGKPVKVLDPVTGRPTELGANYFSI